MRLFLLHSCTIASCINARATPHASCVCVYVAICGCMWVIENEMRVPSKKKQFAISQPRCSCVPPPLAVLSYNADHGPFLLFVASPAFESFLLSLSPPRPYISVRELYILQSLTLTSSHHPVFQLHWLPRTPCSGIHQARRWRSNNHGLLQLGDHPARPKRAA